MATFNSPSDSSFKPKDMELIFSTTLTSDANSIDTGTLSTGFRDLLISASLKCDINGPFGDDVRLFFNNDQTLSNYQQIRSMILDGSPQSLFDLTESSVSVAPGLAVSGPGSPGTPAFFGGFTVRIFRSESSDRFKVYNAFSNCQSGATMEHNFLEIYAMAYKNSAAITSIQFECKYDSDFVIGSSINIYGIK